MNDEGRKSKRQQLRLAVNEVPSKTFSSNPDGSIPKGGESREMTRKEAIRAKCLDCCAGSRAEIRRCDDEECALWPYRLGTRAKIDSGARTAAKRGVFDVNSAEGHQESREDPVDD